MRHAEKNIHHEARVMKASSGQVRVSVQIATAESGLPASDDFLLWVNSAVEAAGQSVPADTSVTIRVVDESESSALNGNFRDVAKPTNVLAFPVIPDEFVAGEAGESELGDLAICAPVVLREATEQAKTLAAHFAHMTVHGSLHLLGYDHINEQDATTMEALEQQVMEELGFPDPYSSNKQQQ
jgi:probable rRNA maturation factor